MKRHKEIQQLSEQDFNNRQGAGHYELADLKSRGYYCDGFVNGYSQCQIDLDKGIYSEVENLIIKWSNEGTKTAGTLTREIMVLLKNK